MALKHDQLPDDIEQLKRLLLERDVEVLAARLMIEKLKLQIARYRRLQFGRKSERHDAHVAQLELIVEELETSLAVTTSVPATSAAAAGTPDTSPRTPPVRRPPPAHLPRENVVHAAACNCPDCGGELKRIGEDVSEQLEFIPEHFKVIRHVRPKCQCQSETPHLCQMKFPHPLTMEVASAGAKRGCCR
jgi:transposase